ncbi:hypothetical protein Moror_17761 [Moniliophthora roreri MCA 2997]|uniref:Mid2 domain-containing protein n=2 Tax=Moniliophthora roreri TaxID=221103 RepID=V2XXQ7_MONRO|nr:hypothetical protein Moror_17761 [Moniliophthora roreri MCA 2997]KAI3618849.1 hypothetical protein WG66_000514 [Moniliophthora roreri]
MSSTSDVASTWSPVARSNAPTAIPFAVNNGSDDSTTGQDSNSSSSSSGSQPPVNASTGSASQSPNSTLTNNDTAPTSAPVRINAGEPELTTEPVISTFTTVSALTDAQGVATGSTTITGVTTTSVVRTRTPLLSSTSIPSAGSSLNIPVAMIIGVVGGVIALICGGLFILCVLRRRRRNSNQLLVSPYPFSGIGISVGSARFRSSMSSRRDIDRNSSLTGQARNTWVTFGSDSDETYETLPSYRTDNNLPSYRSIRSQSQ